jgi:hypothetical protein
MECARLFVIGLAICGLCSSPLVASAKPTITAVELSTTSIQNGGSVTVTVTAISESPVNWINRSLDGPGGNIYGGGGGWPPWTQIGENAWHCTWDDTTSPWAPSGTYTYSGISCQNEAQLTLDIRPDISFNAANRQISSFSKSADGEVTIEFPTEDSPTFILQFSESLSPAAWTNIGSMVGIGDSMTICHKPEPESRKGFYRVIKEGSSEYQILEQLFAPGQSCRQFFPANYLRSFSSPLRLVS